MNFFERDKQIYKLKKKNHPNILRVDIANRIIKKSNAKKILDLGCGIGYFHSVISRNKSVEKVTNIDISNEALKIFKDKFYNSKS